MPDIGYSSNTGGVNEYRSSSSNTNKSSDIAKKNEDIQKAMKDIAESKTTQTKSKIKADKEFIETEFSTLSGELVLMPSERVMHLRIGETIQLQGLGTALNGSYLVTGIRRNISSSGGYEMSCTVTKTAFSGKLYSPKSTRSKEVPKKPKESK